MRVVTEKEAAEMLGMSVGYLRNARCYGGDAPPHVKFGKAVRYVPADIEAWITAHRVQPEQVPE